MTRIRKIVLFAIIIVSAFATSISAFDVEWLTLEGTVRSSDTFGLVLVTDHGQTYSISGKCTTELKKLVNIEVRVAAKRVSSIQTYLIKGNIDVIEYSIVGNGYYLGNLRLSSNGVVLVGQDHAIYKLRKINKHQITKLLNSTVVVKGIVKKHWWKKYYATLDVEYIVYIKPAKYSKYMNGY